MESTYPDQAAETPLLFQSRRRGISLTPLIDVVFILLMFFMLTSSFSQWRAVDFFSPTEAAVTAEKPAAPQILILQADQRLRLANGELNLAHYRDFSPAMLQHFERDAAVLLAPQASVRVQDIVSALEALQQAGLHRATLGKSLPEAQVKKAGTK
ncbi:ExbD/TolR family protein [Microbulbifer sp. SA54]|uniref:ExbD/TolR family protein n=1 Tax=Microbulbifer sp. SA54 TaxID=3401577 RepID=UPI003AAD26D2